ncbi:asparagine synthase (glutamine-hydrolyzing) [uncultured Senegalimassilia sp.]|uniref:asparagine synthase (glutamine-hydrolyzing) n=1 Tax=uncultured Senegalimassilia sp. TaxID=1714350 RepID=UPI00258C8945|nr:asparagine synthase (glutamine-hydrolyzing) [uncultured Senegalimassilia sp.]
MCGFTGFINNTPGIDAQRVIELMGDRIRHRGPDDATYYVDDDVALAHRRLSIIDLEGGRQPMFNEDGNLVIVFNGEIYNYQELREELVAAGHVFATHSDTETILHGFEQWGRGVLDRLRGMFAFAIWDKREKKLFGARDIFGIKPYYYYRAGSTFLFGSEIKSFLDHPAFKKSVVRERIPDYLSYEYLPDNKTLFRDVFKLMPGSWFEWTADSFVTERYYDYTFKPDESLTLEQWADRIEDVFTKSVDAHMIADVEVGGFLSSGVDSSYAVERAYSAGTNIRTFSVGYEEEQYSELSYAQSFSEELGVENIANKISADDFFDAMPDIQYYMDEPLPNPAENPLYFLAENAAKHVKVVLSGEGADELFGGYPNYLAEDHLGRYCERIPRGVRKVAGAVAGALPAVKGKHFLTHGAMEPWERFSRADYVFENEDRQQYLRDKITGPTPQEGSKPYFDHVAGLDAVSQLQYVDMQTWMAFDILLKADRMSMAHSLELRVPFLDREVLELALTIPARYRVANDESKVALRRAAARHLPERVYNKEKLGFPSPLAVWLRDDKFYNRVKDAFEGSVAQEFFVPEKLMELLDEHKSGRVSNMQKIWSFYTFIVWYEEFFGEGERAQCRA